MSTTTAPDASPDTAAPETAGEWLPIAAAATRLNRHPRSVERAAASGRIPARRTAEGRLEVFVQVAGAAASTQTEPPADRVSGDRHHEVVVMERDRHAVALAALGSTERMLVGTREEAAAARRAAWCGWAAAAGLAIAGLGTASWISSSGQRERGEMAVQLSEARVAAAAAERLLAASEAALVSERIRNDQAIAVLLAATAPGSSPDAARQEARQEAAPPAPAPGTVAAAPGLPAWWPDLLARHLGD